MGVSGAWVAVRGMDRAQVLALMGLAEADGAACVRPASVELADGWLIVLTPAPEGIDLRLMQALSVGGQVLAFDGHDGLSTAQGYQDGQPFWSVTQDRGPDRLFDVEILGAPPPDLAPILDRLMAETARGGADFDSPLDVPAELCAALCGFRLNAPDPAMTPLLWASARAVVHPDRGRIGTLTGLFRRRSLAQQEHDCAGGWVR